MSEPSRDQPVLIALRRIGPYHHSRLLAAAAQMPLVALETRPNSLEYPWEFEPGNSYPIEQINCQGDPESDPVAAELDLQIAALFERWRPAAVVSVGWVDRTMRLLLQACQRRRLACVIVSDSRVNDTESPRRWPLELIKRGLLRGYGAALVAGGESRAYLKQLGFDPSRIEQPWDVVDNAAFAAAAARARQHQAALSPHHRSEPHFLCVSRFIAKKNHARLLEAYASYQRGGGSWGLRLLGCGPLQNHVEAAVAALPVPERVKIEPFQQLEGVQRCYGEARAFVLASSSDQWGLVVNEAMAAGLPVLVSRACGCAVDLVEHGVSGWCFDPHEPAELTALLHTAEAQTSTEREAMVADAQKQLEPFSPNSFAAGLARAVNLAQAHQRRSRLAIATLTLLRAL